MNSSFPTKSPRKPFPPKEETREYLPLSKRPTWDRGSSSFVLYLDDDLDDDFQVVFDGDFDFGFDRLRPSKRTSQLLECGHALKSRRKERKVPVCWSGAKPFWRLRSSGGNYISWYDGRRRASWMGGTWDFLPSYCHRWVLCALLSVSFYSNYYVSWHVRGHYYKELVGMGRNFITYL